MTWIALGAFGLVVLMLLGRLFVDAKPAQVKQGLVWGAGALGVVLLAALLISGRGMQAMWAAVLFGPAVMRVVRSWRAAQTFARGGAATGGQASDVDSAWLSMVLDHDSGQMAGTVKRGAFAGRDLAELDQPQLLALRAELAGDADSLALLDAWLDRAWPEWRAAAPPTRDAGPMSRAEALEILGLADGATEEEIRAAHRRLMRSAHPDQGGSDWLASRLNAARDLLLGP